MADDDKKTKVPEKVQGAIEIGKGILGVVDWVKELPHLVRTIILAVACLGAGSATTIYVAQRSPDTEVKRMLTTIADLDRTVTELRANNKQLANDKDSLIATNQSLATESVRQGQTITGLTVELGKQHSIIGSLAEESRRNQQIISDLANAGSQFDKGLGDTGTAIRSVIEGISVTKDTITSLIPQVNSLGVQQ